MIGKSPNREQKHLYMPDLDEFINPQHELCLLAEKIDWELCKREFALLYSDIGASGKASLSDRRIIDLETGLQSG